MTNQNDIFSEGKLLPIVEEFYSIQGEGFHMGEAAYFIRLGGCDIGCNWCDTKFSWTFSNNSLIDVDSLIQRILYAKAESVVVTGGEPTNYNLNYLTSKLKSKNIKTFLETAGSYSLTGIWNWICLSPKRNFPPLKEILLKADELKIIIYNNEDFNWAEENSMLVHNNCYLFLQPEWSRYKTVLQDIVEYVKINPKWKISLQAHKFMRIP